MTMSGKNPIINSLSKERYNYRNLNSPIKRLLVFPNGASLCTLKKASLTVEAALILPLFFMAVICISSIMGIYTQTLEEMVTLRNRSEQAAMAASFTETESWIDLLEPISYKPYYLPDGVTLGRILCRGRVRSWSGRDRDDENEEIEGSQYIYVTENKGVYHTHADCSHLELSVHSISAKELSKARNENGGRYKACERCVHSDGAKDTVYITNEGDRYHNDSSCSGIKRTVTMVNIKEAEGLKECSRCAARAS